MKRALLLLATLPLLAACASGHPATRAAETNRPAARPVSLRVPTLGENLAAARREGEQRLRSLRLPAGSQPLHWRHGKGSSRGFLRVYGAWRVPLPRAAVRAYLQRHDRHTRLFLQPLSALSADATAVRAIAFVQYVLPLPPRDRVPAASVREVSISSRISPQQPPLASARVTDRGDAERIAGWFDRLGRVPPRQACLLMARFGPTVTVVFRDSHGGVVARAVVADTEHYLSGCDGFRLTVGGRTLSVVGGDVLQRIQLLLGINLNPAKPIACPSRPPDLHAQKGLSGDTLVRPHATSLLLCRYVGFRVRRNEVGKPATLDRLTRELNALRPAKGVFHCLMDNGDRILLLFGYAAKRIERVVVSTSGCRFATNGRVNRYATPKVLRELESLSGRAGTS